MTLVLLHRTACAGLLVLAAGAPAAAQTGNDLSTNAAPTAATRRVTATSGYGDPTRGGKFLNPRGQAGSIGLSGTRELASGSVRVEATLSGARSLGMRGYGHATAGAATAFHRLPVRAAPVDPLTPAERRARAILPGATLPQVGP